MSQAGEDLAAAVRALLPTRWTRYDGEATGAATPPWIVSGVGVPDGAHRSDGAHTTAGDLDVYVNVAAENEKSARIILTAVAEALDGARVTAAGWEVGALIEYQRPRTYPTDVDLAGTSRHIWAGAVGYRATCSRLREDTP